MSVSSAAHARTISNGDMILVTSVASLVKLALLLDQMPKLANNSHNNEGNIQDQCTVFLSDQRLKHLPSIILARALDAGCCNAFAGSISELCGKDSDPAKHCID
jgi:hypothetical protein